MSFLDLRQRAKRNKSIFYHLPLFFLPAPDISGTHSYSKAPDFVGENEGCSLFSINKFENEVGLPTKQCFIFFPAEFSTFSALKTVQKNNCPTRLKNRRCGSFVQWTYFGYRYAPKVVIGKALNFQLPNVFRRQETGKVV